MHTEDIIYKQIGETKLFIRVCYPERSMPDTGYPAAVCYFGGAWVTGDVGAFAVHAEFLCRAGFKCFLADYRIQSKHNSTIYESTDDACDAFDFIYENADIFAIDPTKIITTGGSAGGHLALAVLFRSRYGKHAAGAAAFNPAANLDKLFRSKTEGLLKHRDFFEAALADPRGADSVDPMMHTQPGGPPIIIFHGVGDKTIPIDLIMEYRDAAVKAGVDVTLMAYENAGHGFFRANDFRNPFFFLTFGELLNFLRRINVI